MTTFKNRDDVLTLLIHLGYVSFDEKKREVFIPNQEIVQEFLGAVKTGGWGGLMQALDSSERLLKSSWLMDGKSVADGMDGLLLTSRLTI